MAGLTEFQLAVNESLASAIDTAFSYPYEESYQTVSVGFNGGEYVYIQGTPAGDHSGKFLYPTFQSFDQALEFDHQTKAWVKSPLSFTDQLLDLYSNIQYRESYEAAEIAKKNSERYVNAINRFWSGAGNNYIDYFGPGSSVWSDLLPQGLDGVSDVDIKLKPFVDSKIEDLVRLDRTFYLKEDLSDSLPVEKINAIEAAYVWSIVTALNSWGSSLTRDGRDLLARIAKKNDINESNYSNLSDQEKDIIAGDFVRFFSSGSRDYQKYFTANFSGRSPNPFYALWPNYVELLTDRNLGLAANQIKLVMRNNLESASRNLSEWYAYDPEISVIRSDQFSQVYLPGTDTDERYEWVCETKYDDVWEEYYQDCEEVAVKQNYEEVPSSFTEIIPKLGPFSVSGSAVQDLMLDAELSSQDVGVSVDISMEQKSGNVYSIYSGSQSREVTNTKDSSDASYFGFFLCAGYSSESSSESEREDMTSFNSYASDTETKSFSVQYKDSFSQSWSPTTSGPGMWLAESTIRSMMNNAIYTDENNNLNYDLPYIGIDKWPGGFGFQSVKEAYKFLKNGFAVIDSIIYTANPSVSMNIQNTSSQSSNWEESSFSKSQYSNSTAMGFGGWIFGHSGGKSVEGEDISNFDSTSVSSSDEFGEFTITSSGLGGINGNEVNGPNPYYGYAGLEIGYRVKVIADPNPFIVVKDDAQPLARRSAGSGVGLRKALFKNRKDSIKLDDPYVKTKQEATHLGSGDNVVIGDKNGDLITGGKGDDIIFALKGSDFIRGGPGNDFLSPGTGRNKLWGGSGADKFEIHSADFFARKLNQTGDSMNKIYDYSVAENDILWFTGYWDGDSIVADDDYVVVNGFKVAKLIGLSSDDVQCAIDTAVFIDFS